MKHRYAGHEAVPLKEEGEEEGEEEEEEGEVGSLMGFGGLERIHMRRGGG